MRHRTSQRWSVYLALPLVFGTVLSLILFELARDRAEWELWKDYLPLGQWPVYGDLAVTLEHLSEAARGGDPLSDPNSEFAYPRALLVWHHLGIQHIPATWLGLLQSILAVGGIVFVIRPRNLWQSIATALLFVTPPLLLGFERANLDFLLFLLCAGCALAWARAQTIPGLTVPVAGLVLGAVAKLHPVFALVAGAFVEQGKRRLIWLLGLGLLLIFWAYTWSDFGLISKKVPTASLWGSWGGITFFERVGRFVDRREAYSWLWNTRWELVAVLTYAVTGGLAFAAGNMRSRRFNSTVVEPRDYAYYWIGAAICCGSFAGANYAYRWIFLLLTIPLLGRLASSDVRAVALWSRVTLIAIVVSLVAPLQGHPGVFLVTQFANWTCIHLLIAGCAAMRISANPFLRSRRKISVRIHEGMRRERMPETARRS